MTSKEISTVDNIKHVLMFSHNLIYIQLIQALWIHVLMYSHNLIVLFLFPIDIGEVLDVSMRVKNMSSDPRLNHNNYSLFSVQQYITRLDQEYL